MKKTMNIIIRHVVLALLAFIWLIPIVWLFVTSLSSYKGVNYRRFFPTEWSLDNYAQLFFRPDTAANFPAWFKNSLIIGIFTCIRIRENILAKQYKNLKTEKMVDNKKFLS